MPVPDFSPGEVLTAAAMDSIGLWLVKTQTVGTAVSSVTVTGAFSSAYTNYKITYNGGVISANADISLQFGPSSVSGYNTSYDTGLTYGTPAAFAYAYSSAGSSFSWIGGGSTSVAQVSVEINGPNLAKFTRMHCGSYQNNVAFGNSFGEHRQSGQYTDFTLIPGFGATLTGGIIRVYGYRN
jgi:hypothetical protein